MHDTFPRRTRARASRRLGAALAVCACLGATTSPARAEGAPVIAARATEIAMPVTVEALGTARANEAVEIRAQINERVTEIRFREGEEVEAGQVLVALDATRARADVAAARATLAESEAQLARATQLRDARSMAQAEYDTRLARRDADRAALRVSETALAETRVRAPFAGRVGLRRVSAGSLVDSATLITTLDDLDPIKLDFDVPETELAHLRRGRPLTARSAAYPGEPFRGEVASVDSRVDPVSRSVTVRGVLPNAEGRLLPGMFLTVELVRDEVRALVVPEQAIVPEQSRQYVWVIDGEGRAQRRQVHTGRRQPERVEILSGLRAGEWVIAEGTQRARHGAPVDVVEELAFVSDEEAGSRGASNGSRESNGDAATVGARGAAGLAGGSAP